MKKIVVSGHQFPVTRKLMVLQRMTARYVVADSKGGGRTARATFRNGAGPLQPQEKSAQAFAYL